MPRTLLLLALLALAVKQGAGTKCYICESSFDENCGDPMDTTRVTVKNCSYSGTKDFINSVIDNIHGFSKLKSLFSTDVPYPNWACLKLTFLSREDKEIVLRTCVPDVSIDMCELSANADNAFCEQCMTDACNDAVPTGYPTTLLYILLPFVIILLATRS